MEVGCCPRKQLPACSLCSWDTLCCASLARPDGAGPPDYMRTMLQGDYEGAMQAAQRCYFTALQREGEGSRATLPHAVRFGVMLLGGWHGPLCLCIAPSGLSGGALPVPRGSASCLCMSTRHCCLSREEREQQEEQRFCCHRCCCPLLRPWSAHDARLPLSPRCSQRRCRRRAAAAAKQWQEAGAAGGRAGCGGRGPGASLHRPGRATGAVMLGRVVNCGVPLGVHGCGAGSGAHSLTRGTGGRAGGWPLAISLHGRMVGPAAWCHPQPPPSFLPPWGVLRVPLPRWRLQGMMEQLFDHTVVSPLLVLFSP